ncbi:hypothetical protein [Streptomyces sp. NPDC056468]|uniref:hypothetical protein n=1 Tax=Streptomyces sp. NPDC056468 TaxID=3345830 RepID=UPI0036C0C932
MADFHTYGTSELVRLVGDCLGLVFSERDSDYRGVYHLAGIQNGRTEIQPNAIPGDDGGDDLYAPEQPAAQVLLLTITSTPDPALHARLGSIEGLIHLHHQET